MSKKILGLDLGSNSLGWALLEEDNGSTQRVIDIGCRIFSKAVEKEVPTPKNVKRRNMRLGRRVLQRRARRKQRMLNYLVSLKLLPKELQGNTQPEVLLNEIGNPYELRTKALDHQLTPYEFGRVLLHFVARRGFLSSKKQMAGDLVDDPDTIAYLNALDDQPTKDKEEGAFKAEIAKVRSAIEKNDYRTLGEYLYNLERGQCKRNRQHADGNLRTDRKMYQDELEQIWQKQKQYFKHLQDDFMTKDKGIQEIIFYQRPLKLKKDRVGKCSLEPKNNRAAMARLEVQRFRYLQDVNNLKYFERHTSQMLNINDNDKQKLKIFFENSAKINLTTLKKELGLDSKTKLNLESKDLKGNTTARAIRTILKDAWDSYTFEHQKLLVEDLLSIKKKSALKSRLINHWQLSTEQAVQLCLIEFEPGHSSHSLKAINKLLPYLEQGLIYADARVKAGYGYETKEITVQETLGKPPETSNPIVNRGMHELKRVTNAIIKHYGKPDVIRVEMARDLEMNTKRYKEHQARQDKNKKENIKAVDAYRELKLGQYPSHDDKIKYRLWEEQDHCCAYSCKKIPLNAVFTADVEIDHILPYKKSLDDSYMNKVLCYTAENRSKGDKTPKDAWSGNKEKWNQITQAISGWKGLESKVNRFYQTEADIQERDFISSQLNDVRYIAKLALDYLKLLGCDVTTSKGATTAWLRHQWGLNSLIGETDKKERTDHRHHAIDAAVIACVDRRLYQQILNWTKNNVQELKINSPYGHFRDELDERLKHLTVSHDPQRKLSGSLHDETGAGYIKKHGGLVYRKVLSTVFVDSKGKFVSGKDAVEKNANGIVDETIKKLVLSHLEKYGDNAKKAFAEDIVVYHKDGKTPIKRVRVLQSKTSMKILEESKFGVKDKSGNIFKWMPYGNTHHVEILQHNDTGKYTGVFVTMMEAHRRAMTGTRSAKNRSIEFEEIIKQDHGDELKFIIALHKNDLVSVEKNGLERNFYRVQKLGGGYDLTLRLHTETSVARGKEFIDNHKLIEDSFHNLFSKRGLKLHKINAIGVLIS